MTKKLAIVLLVLACVVIAGTVTKTSTYNVTLFKSAAVNGSVLKAGDYKLVVGDAKVTLIAKDGGATVESPVKFETAAAKFGTTVVTYEDKNSKTVVSEIDLGGSKTKILFAQ